MELIRALPEITISKQRKENAKDLGKKLSPGDIKKLEEQFKALKKKALKAQERKEKKEKK